MRSYPRSSTKQERTAAFSSHLLGASSPQLGLVSQREGTRRLQSGCSVSRLAGHPRRKAYAPTPQDRTFNEDKRVEYDAATLVTTVTAVATVDRPFEEVVQLLDPRAWAARTELWLASYAVQLDGAGRVIFDRNGVPVCNEPESDEREWGKPWCGVLYELTDWDMTEQFKTRFDVLLNIEFTQEPTLPPTLLFTPGPEEQPLSDARSLLHTYKLNEALRGQLGYQILDGGVDVDAGYAYAIECLWRGKRVTRVEAQKSVRYADFTPDAGDEGPFDSGLLFNYLAPAILGVWIGSLVGEGLNASLDI